MEPHMTCLKPLEKYDLNYVFVPFFIVKDGAEYVFSELTYQETSIPVYDGFEIKLTFDFKFTYNGVTIEERDVDHLEIGYNGCFQVFNYDYFEKEDLNDMYMVFYKNERHDGNYIYDVSIYHNMKRVMELKNFKEFADINDEMNFRDFSYVKSVGQGYEETWRVTDFVESLVDTYDPWEEAEKEHDEEQAYIDSIESMDYEELKQDYLQTEGLIRKKLESMIGKRVDFKLNSSFNELIDEEKLKEAYRIYLELNSARIEPPENAGEVPYVPTAQEKMNDQCMVFENGVVSDYIHLSTNTSAEWDENDYYRAKHYAEDCRYIRVDGVTYDLMNPKEIMNIPVGETKINDSNIEPFLSLIGYNRYDLKLRRIRNTETDRLSSLLLNDGEISNAVLRIREEGVQKAFENYVSRVIEYKNEKEILLSNTDIRGVVENYLCYINDYIVEKKDIGLGTPEWVVKYLKTIGADVDVRQYDQEHLDMECFCEFWDYERSMAFAKMMTQEGIDEASGLYLRLAAEFCEDNNLEIDPAEFIDYILDVFGITDSDDSDDYEDFEDDDEDDFEDEDDYVNNDLYDFLYSRTTGCFDPALLVPLAHVTVNMAIRDGKMAYGCERIVAQLVANGEDEYGKMLDSELSKRNEYWDESKSVLYGNSLKYWAINSREYHWLKGNFPEITPKSKGAYSTAKKKRTKRYLEIKRLAESNGYYLDDHTCDYSCW